MILKANGKDYSFTATMRKIVAINEVTGAPNLRDAFFKALNNVDFKFLGDTLMALADEKTKEMLDETFDIYDLIEAYVTENKSDYSKLYELLAKELNDKSFFGKKMSEKDLAKEMKNPLVNFDMNQAMNNALEKVMGEEISKQEILKVETEEFKGYQG